MPSLEKHKPAISLYNEMRCFEGKTSSFLWVFTPDCRCVFERSWPGLNSGSLFYDSRGIKVSPWIMKLACPERSYISRTIGCVEKYWSSSRLSQRGYKPRPFVIHRLCVMKAEFRWSWFNMWCVKKKPNSFLSGCTAENALPQVFRKKSDVSMVEPPVALQLMVRCPKKVSLKTAKWSVC